MNEAELLRSPGYLYTLRKMKKDFDEHREAFMPYESFDAFYMDVIATPAETFHRIMKYFDEHKPKPRYLYAMHITHGPNMCSKLEWLNALVKLLKLKKAGDIIGGAIEHVDANIHCHVLVETSNRLGKGSMATFEKNNGYIRYDRSSGDHGFTDEYMSQDYSFRSLLQLQDQVTRIVPLLNEEN